MRFTVYARFVLDVVKQDGQWIAYRIGNGIRRREHDLMIPADMDANDLVVFLDDIYHELAIPGQRIERLDD